MVTLLWVIAGIGVVWVLAGLGASGYVWTAAVAVALGSWTTLGSPPEPLLWTAWTAFAGVAAVANLPFLRRLLVSNTLLKIARKRIPPVSQTEREALEAGTVWWDADLFSGRPNWRKLLTAPAPKLSEEEKAFLDGPVDELCRMLDDWRINEEYHDLPPEVWKFIKDHGFFGMIIPKKYGGREFSALAHSTVVMKVGSRSLVAAVTIMVPNSLGPAELLLLYGTEEQKNYYLPRLARGEEVPCFALTSPEAGSDAASIIDSGVVCRGDFEGRKDILGIRLSWNKRYITLAPVATVLGVAFKLYDPEHLIGDRDEVGITLALIPTTAPGVEIGRRHSPLSIKFMNGPTTGRDVFIPLDWIIGGAEQAGQGWRMLMNCLAAGRSISLPALSTGSGKLSCMAVGAYARIRNQFKTPIGYFEGIEEALGRIAGSTYLMDSARVMTAGAVDMGEKPSVISAMAKYHLTEIMRQVVNDAMDILGGRGISLGPRNFMGRLYQAIPISITVEGANILTRNLIIFGQGAIRCHPWVLKEMQAVLDEDRSRGSRLFDQALFGHVSFLLQNVARSVFFSLTGGRIIPSPETGPTAYYYRQLTRMCSSFALTADVAMLVMGGALKRAERLSARLGDILSHLYFASCSLKRYTDQGRPAEDLPLLEWSCQTSLHLVQQRLDELIRNFPNRPVAWLLRLIVFPLGKPYRPPADALGREIAHLLLAPSDTRDRLAQGVYRSTDPLDPTGRLEVALRKVLAAVAVERKLKKARKAGQLAPDEDGAPVEQALQKGIISQDEARLYQEAAEARRDVIQVDDFPKDYWTGTARA